MAAGRDNEGVRLLKPRNYIDAVAETEGFEPSIGLYNPITV
jgi:hypothetical protein